MKSWLSSSFTALLFLLAFTSNAQEDCECPPADPAEYCALNFLTGDIDTVFGTVCELACDGWLILEDGSCDDGSDPTDPWDCECDYSEYAPVCVTMDDGTLFTFFNACEASCLGFDTWEEGECDYSANCDCPDDEPELEYCVLNLMTGEQETIFGSECMLWCEGFLVLNEGPCEDIPDGCDCDYSIYEPVCVTLDDGAQFTFFNACDAECNGFTDWTEGECDFGGPCDCPGDDPVYEFCVINPWTGEQETVTGSECELFCEGFLLMNEGSCEDIPGECDCDYSIYEPVCVTTDDGELYSFYNACEAECFGYSEYSEGECEYPDPCEDCPEDEPVMEYCGINLNTGEFGTVSGQECQLWCEGWLILNEGPCEDDGCGCPDEEVGTYCVMSWWTDEVITMEGSPCQLECDGYFIVGDGECEDIPDPCDCEGEEIGIYCVGSWWTDEIMTVEGSICELECEGYYILGDGECDDLPDPCDCPEDEWGVFCVSSWWSDEVFTIEGNPCELECEGFIIVGEGECEDEGCGCSEDEPVGVYCALNTWMGIIETVEGSECELFCEGYIILTDGACDEVDPEGCDCPEDEAPQEFCVIDWETGDVYTVESTPCLLECEGIFLYEEGPCEDTGDPVDPCDCPDEEAGQYCVINLWTGEQDVVTGTECELFCEGFLIIGEGDCEDFGGGDPEDGCDCPEEEQIDFCVLDFTTGETIAMTSTACELVCDGYFIFWEGSCDDINGADDGDGNTLTGLEDWSEDIDIDDFMMFPVPADDLVNVKIQSSGEGIVNVELFSLTGQLLEAEQWTLNGGTEVRQLNIGHLAPGMYTITLTSKNGKRTSGQIIRQ